MAIHAYTSFSFSYLNRARVWAKSLKKIHPDWIVWAVISDIEPNGFVFDLNNEPFDKLMTAVDLFGGEAECWLFGMDVIETCTAVKGRALNRLLEMPNVDQVFYFDPDTAVFNTMAPIVQLLNEFSIVLTPHQIDPEPRDNRLAILDNEAASLQYGVFNLGFIAVSNDDESRRFASWWEDRLNAFCHDRLDIGIFVDQKWCNLVPCFFDNVKILRDPGYNVASWNLSQRKIDICPDGNIYVNNCLLRFFHFTKLGPIGDVMTSRYAQDNVEVYEIWSAYKRMIESNSDSLIPQKYWYYGNFRNGKKIPKLLREKYRERKDLQEYFVDPFNSYDQFLMWSKHEKFNCFDESSE